MACSSKTKKLKPDRLYVGVFDFSKAFDRVNIPMLISKLKKQGACGRLLASIKSMFENRKSQVRVNGKLSKKFPVGRGVAQGCPMSPLFSIFM